MKPRYTFALLLLLILTTVPTAILLVGHQSAAGFAEITVSNFSPDVIQNVWFQHLSLAIREHDIKAGKQKSIRFYVDERNPDRTCQILVSFEGGGSQSCDVVINNGEKGAIDVYPDRIDSDVLKRTRPGGSDPSTNDDH